MAEITSARLANQWIGGVKRSPAEVVAAMGAMQAQDFNGAKWALGLRAQGATDASIEAAFDRGEIVRSHPMRGTHHWVAPADLRWLLELIAPRSHRLTAGRHRNLGLDHATIEKSMRGLQRALEGGKDLTRAETAAVLTKAGISPEGQRLPHIIMHAELIGLVCSGPKRGKQITIALLDERIPRGRKLGRDEAIVELCRRYFTTRGPATVKDFVWWSSLTVADARAGIAGAGLRAQVIDGVEVWRGEQRKAGRIARAHLLPAYDEYTVAYQNRAHAGTAPKHVVGSMEQWLLSSNVIVDGVIAGTWSRGIRGAKVKISLEPWRKLSRDEMSEIEEACDRYARFVGRERA